ncbi:hypothetical protein OG311_13600 [Streptomyces sp. NBC_01343]|uniref:hypothetical protein n=1 Tax=Streptomyces sp. NBC_01343 TaxID=2903832 RepID=UPI002E138F29|nr:hypothetical protein OG311_13600 [Streptomyces sp. NBC_01343]
MPLAGEIVRASDVIRDSWTAYTPVWSASGTAVSLGNGTVTGQYMQVGSMVWVKIVFTAGSSTTYGTGFWRLTLPVTPELNELIPGFANDNSAGIRVPMVARIIAASTSGENMRIACNTTAGGAGPAQPFTWATDDVLILNGQYKAA